MKYGIGQPVRRKEDVRFVSGAGRYTGDIVLEGEVHAAFLRSSHAHARIIGVDLSAAKASPGVLDIVLQSDIGAKVDVLGLPGAFKNRDGSLVKSTPKTLLTDGKARFVGDAIAMVIAESAAQAKDAAELISVDYEPLEAAGTLGRAGQADDLWDEMPGNIAFDWQDGNEQAAAEAFASAAKTVSVSVVQNRVAPAPMEPRAAIGVYDGEAYTLYSGTQGSGRVRDRVASLIKVSPEKLRVITPDVGGGFGQKAMVTVELALVLIAARRLGRPVKWLSDRTENLLSDSHGRDMETVGELALDENAKVLAVRVRNTANMGAYMSQVGPNVSTGAGYRILGGIYRVPVAHAQTRGYYTNTAPLSSYRGAGRPEAAYLMDRLLDKAADAFGIDRIEIRRRNLLSAEEFPYKSWRGIRFDSGNPLRNLEDAVQAMDWAGFEARRQQSAARGKLRGRGVAYYMEMTGGPQGVEEARYRFHADGSLDIYVGSQASGQGHETAFAQIAAEQLGVAYDSIRIIQGDSADNVQGQTTVGARTMHSVGPSVEAGAVEVIRKGKIAAAHILQAGGKEVVFDIHDGTGRFTVLGTERGISVAELASTLKREAVPEFEQGLDSEGTFTGLPTFPNGCHMCEAEVDPETGQVELVAYVIVDDLGRLINPLLVEGQVQGGVAQGLGQAILEHVRYDGESGQMLTATFQDYAMPRASDMPKIDFRYNEILCTTNPLGAKGAGEAGTTGALQAVVAAISDALGVPHIDMPATPERVWQALRQKSV